MNLVNKQKLEEKQKHTEPKRKTEPICEYSDCVHVHFLSVMTVMMLV